MRTCASAVAQDPLRGQQWNLDAIHADTAHRISIGTGAVVAVVDSGVNGAHEDLAGNAIDGPDLIDRDATPNDQHGHGTNVAGIIGARAGNGRGIEGAAPGAKSLAIRVLDAYNAGDTDQEAAGIHAAIAGGAHVINLSLSAGFNIVTPLLPCNGLVRAIERGRRRGRRGGRERWRAVVRATVAGDEDPLRAMAC